MTNQSSQPARFSARKFIYTVMAAVVAGAVIIFLTHYINKWLTSKDNRPSSMPVVAIMRYEVRREDESKDQITLTSDNTFRSGENLFFRVQLFRPGLVFLFHKNKDQSMKWLNPGSNNEPQLISGDEWLDIPKDRWIGTVGMDVERFLFVYAPIGSQWSLEKIVHPQNITIGKSRFPEFPREAALRLVQDLETNAMRMSSSSTQEGREVINQLMAPSAADKVVYHDFELLPKG
jgi:hypothetical protein